MYSMNFRHQISVELLDHLGWNRRNFKISIQSAHKLWVITDNERKDIDGHYVNFCECCDSLDLKLKKLKCRPDPSHLIFGINIGKRQIQDRTTLNLNDNIFKRFLIDPENHYSISESFYVATVSFRHFKIQMVVIWTTLQSMDQLEN